VPAGLDDAAGQWAIHEQYPLLPGANEKALDGIGSPNDSITCVEKRAKLNLAQSEIVMNAKILSIVGVSVLALGGIGAYIWWPKDPPAPIVKDDDKKKDKDKPKDNGKPAVKPQTVGYQPAPVSM